MNKVLILIGVVVLLGIGVAIVMTNSGGNADAAKTLFPEGTEGTKVTAKAETPLTRETPPPPGKKAYPAPTQEDLDAAKLAGTRKAVITTSKGVIEADLFGADVPLTVANFVKLAKAKYYDGLTFHRVVPDFVIQGGDQAGDGSGGPGYEIRMETSPKLKHVVGALAMARSQDVNSAGSQFYITLADNEQTRNLDNPDSPYAVFGKVTKGMDVAKKIVIGDKIVSIVIK